MEKLSSRWRNFFQHLGPYVIVIGALALLNWMTSDYPWFLWPALAWGVGLAFHFTEVLMQENAALQRLSGKWRDFLSHFRAYVIVIGMLFLINLFTSTSTWWFIFPALAWGIGLALHFMATVFKESKGEVPLEESLAMEEQSDQDKKDRKRKKKKDKRSDDISPELAPATEQVTDTTIRAHLERARAYQAQIEKIVRAADDNVARGRLQELGVQMTEWVKAIEGLARRIENFQQNSLIHQDLSTVPKAIEDLEARLAGEQDDDIRAQLERTLTSRKNQLVALEKLRRTMHQAEIQIESTLSALGTIYSQLLTGQSTDYVADYSRLSAEVDEEVRTLQDQLEALEEVKLSRY